MKIRAKYKGDTNGKKKYTNGKVYSLNFDLFQKSRTSLKESIAVIKVNDYECNSEIIYPSLKKFNEQWEVV